MTRWLKFNLVGLFGAIVQLWALGITFQLFDLSYLTATMIAVEIAIIHNFLWHVFWTFSDRGLILNRASTWSAFLRNAGRAFLKFQLTAGAVSIPGNAAVMLILVGYLNIHLLIANCLAIAICSTVNFFSADRFSFRHSGAEEF